MQRLNAEICEYCGKTDGYFEMHHKNKLKNTQPGIERRMAQMRRKTIVLCVPCHDMLHAGTLPDMRFLNGQDGERGASKEARRVRRGDEGLSRQKREVTLPTLQTGYPV